MGAPRRRSGGPGWPRRDAYASACSYTSSGFSRSRTSSSSVSPVSSSSTTTAARWVRRLQRSEIRVRPSRRVASSFGCASKVRRVGMSLPSVLWWRHRCTAARAKGGQHDRQGSSGDGKEGGARDRPVLVYGRAMLTLDELRADVESGALDTVIAAFTDMQGRLMGKRLHAEFFLEELDAGREVEGCNYLLALEMEMNPVPGYALASWESGYGDFGLQPDLGTLRRVPWHEATALVLCDVVGHDGTPVAPSPRQLLKAQLEKAHAMGYDAMVGSELEFFLFRESYEEARAKHYHDLTPSVPYIIDYHILGSGYDEPFLREVRNAMTIAGLRVESSKGEAWPGQHEINFRYADALKAADDHVVYKTGLKAMAYQHGLSVTFMAKPDHAWVGSSCHIHSSLWSDGKAAFAGESDVFKHYLAGP